MKVLALDTSNRPMSVALLMDRTVIAKKTTATQLDHSVQLMPTVTDLMAAQGWQPDDLDRVVVAQGPGSYTGLRIAVTTAKTLASTLHIDLVGVSSLAVLAGGVQTEGTFVSPIFDARNTQLYAGLYQIKNGQPVSVIADQHTNIPDWTAQLNATGHKVQLIGELDRYHDALAEALTLQATFTTGDANLPDAGVLGQLGLDLPPVNDIDAFVPQYLRLSPAEAQWAAAHPGEDHTNYVEEV
ncbi:MAG TPA: tRNA (adenosine(37)-N6)-threonylcarbamoyltransferase complex dimerization subunit type 1 TsaB [Lactobacillus sp.]|nr:tRNA (adenosine(37)-N6)-threonylcarbamoyltransferase complex dimerization subunit type 1 TsaB [Lactobacillus sp.]